MRHLTELLTESEIAHGRRRILLVQIYSRPERRSIGLVIWRQGSAPFTTDAKAGASLLRASYDLTQLLLFPRGHTSLLPGGPPEEHGRV